MTYVEFNALANQVANGFAALGIEPGAHVAWWGKNSIETMCAIHATRKAGAVSVPIMDVTWGGGITAARKVAALAEAAVLPVAFHDCSGPVTLAASVQLALACPSVAEQEITRAFYYGWYGDYVDQPPPLENGRIRAPDGPGLGMKLQESALSRPDMVVRRSAL